MVATLFLVICYNHNGKKDAHMRNMDFNKYLSERIIELRKRAGLSAYAVAKAIGKQVDGYYAYESGRRSIPVEILFKLSKLYKISMDDILNSEVTYSREKALSFDLYSSNEKKSIVIHSQNDDIAFFEVDEWTLDYFVKCSDMSYNRKVLLAVNGGYMEAVVTKDEKGTSFCVLNLKDNSSVFYTPKRFINSVVIIGDYAGTLNKHMAIESFF